MQKLLSFDPRVFGVVDFIVDAAVDVAASAVAFCTMLHYHYHQYHHSWFIFGSECAAKLPKTR